MSLGMMKSFRWDSTNSLRTLKVMSSRPDMMYKVLRHTMFAPEDNLYTALHFH